MIASALPTNFLVGDYGEAMMIVLVSHIFHNYAESFVPVASTLGSGLVWREGAQHGNMACAPVYKATGIRDLRKLANECRIRVSVSLMVGCTHCGQRSSITRTRVANSDCSSGPTAVKIPRASE